MRYDEFVNFMAHIAPAVPEAGNHLGRLHDQLGRLRQTVRPSSWPWQKILPPT